ncbi:MAG: hypothetical protein ABJF11_08025 [Reichenbachiella sp.]|uniref:hypothetical protein n=1 Tax=Reichenbachiella sp. TaxID=2184521 RepID=UPI003266E781
MRLTLTTFFLACLFFSCSEDADDSYDHFSGSNSLGKVWQLTAIEVELGTLIPYDCVADNNYTYFSSGRYEVNEGRSKCYENDAPGLSGEYLFSTDRNELVITIGDSVQVWQIITSNATEHKISSEFDGEFRSYLFEAVN